MAKPRAIGMAVVAGLLVASVGGAITGIGCVSAADHRGELGSDGAARKAAFYAAAISESMNCAALYALIVVPLAVVWVIRRKPRDPSSP